MNSVILLPDEIVSEDRAVVTEERAKYLSQFHDLKVGRNVPIGILRGGRGSGKVLEASAERYVFEIQLLEQPLKQNPIHLLVAAPRPQILKRVLLAATQLGVSSVTFINSERGEKSYLQSNLFQKDVLQVEIIKALEQGCDTLAPEIKKAYGLESCLQELKDKSALRIVGDISGKNISELDKDVFNLKSTIIAVGPEAGWSESENVLFQKNGFVPVKIGERVLRVDIAVIALVASVMASGHVAV